jgi:hypothetical protein
MHKGESLQDSCFVLAPNDAMLLPTKDLIRNRLPSYSVIGDSCLGCMHVNAEGTFYVNTVYSLSSKLTEGEGMNE